MNLKLLFSKAQSRYVLKNQVTFAESFLRFASYAEKDEAIYPYWRVFDDEGKFMFIDECFTQNSKANLIEYIIDNRESFWAYMLETSELPRQPGRWGYDTCYCIGDSTLYYIPHFIVYLITLLGGPQIIFGTFVPNSKNLALTIAACNGAKTYFAFTINKLEDKCRGYEYFGFSAIPGKLKTKNLLYLRESIMKRLDKLIASYDASFY